MFAIGFLSLLTAGFAAMSMGGGGDADEYDAEDTTAEDSIEPAPVAQGAGDIDLQFQPADELAPGLDEQIDNFEESDPEASDPATGDEAADQPDPIVADSADEEAQSPTEEVARPPMGDEYRDPLVIAEELDAQREIEEALAEEARQPENLVTVSEADGDEIPDELVLEDSSDEEGFFTVTAPEGEHEIEVDYDPDAVFNISYSADTTAIVSALNSNISGPEGEVTSDRTSSENEAGAPIFNITRTVSFENETDITINVTPEQIGTHIAALELINPADALHFELSDDVGGQLHLVTHEEETENGLTTSSSSTAFVVWTPDGSGEATEAELIEAIASRHDGASGATVLAEIHLGSDSLMLGGDETENVSYTNVVENFVNEDPQITTTLGWASEIGTTDGLETTDTMTDDSGSADGTETLGGNIGATLTGLSVPFSIPGFG